MAEQVDQPRKRGRPRRPEPAEATGFRVTEALRRELDIARAFTGHKSNQALIDEALRAYLLRLRENNDNYRCAAEALDTELQSDAGNVSSITTARRVSASTHPPAHL